MHAQTSLLRPAPDLGEALALQNQSYVCDVRDWYRLKMLQTSTMRVPEAITSSLSFYDVPLAEYGGFVFFDFNGDSRTPLEHYD